MKNPFPNIIYIGLLTLVFLLLDNHEVVAQKTEDIPVTGDFRNKSITGFLDYLEDRYNLTLFYRKEWLDTITIDQQFDRLPLIQALNRTFRSLPFQFEFFQDSSVIFLPEKSLNNSKLSNDDESLMVIGDPLNTGRYKKAILTGKMVDGKNGEPLIGAAVFCPETNQGITTGASGNFEMELPTGDHILQFSYIGFEGTRQQIRLIEPGYAEFELFEKTHNISEVTITGDGAFGSVSQMSMVRIDSRLLKEIPALMGEKDVLKSLTMMAGVQTVSEIASGFNVRGGNTDQNMVLINGAPVFNTSHLFGFLSMLNPDLVEDVRLYKGGLPARFGERVSSVMEVDLKEGNDSILRFYGGIGLLNSRLAFDGPATSNKKLKIAVGGRSSYSDWFLSQVPDPEISQSVTDFYDLSAKATYVFNIRNKISLMGYYSNDKFSTSPHSLMQYGNLVSNLRLRTGFSEKLNSELNLSYSKYQFRLTDRANGVPFESYNLDNDLQYFSGKYHVSWQASEKHLLSFGADFIRYLNNQGTVSPITGVSVVEPKSLEQERLVEMAGFISDEIRLTPDISFSAGLRYSEFLNTGPGVLYLYNQKLPKSLETVTDSIRFGNGEIIKSYGGPEPRISFTAGNGQGVVFRLSYQRTRQYIHQISNNAVVSPAESWKASDYHLRPLVCDQIAMGITKDQLFKGVRFATEVYYKNLKNLIEYKNGAEILMNDHLETSLIPSDGHSYGLEITASKPEGRLTGMLNYTFSRTMRKTSSSLDEEKINRNRWYPSIYDKPHDLSLTATYNLSRRWRFSGNFVYISGRPVTLPELKYEYSGQTLIYYSDRNKYRMPPYHRVDFSLTLDENLKRKRMWKGSWTLSVYNVYGRKNPYSVYYRKTTPDRTNDFRSFALYRLAVIGIPVPTLTYNFTF